MKHVEAFFELADELENKYPHLYVEVARTRISEWCVLLSTNPEGGRKLAGGQCSTPDQACKAALEDYESRQPKVLDWDDVADGVMTYYAGAGVHFGLHDIAVSSPDGLRLSDRWQLWMGGKCPLPNYVMIEGRYDGCPVHTPTAASNYYRWDGSDKGRVLNAYRITGLTDGYKYPDEVE